MHDNDHAMKLSGLVVIFGPFLLRRTELNLSIVNFVDAGPSQIEECIHQRSFRPRDLGILESVRNYFFPHILFPVKLN